jgi:hemolysin III
VIAFPQLWHALRWRRSCCSCPAACCTAGAVVFAAQRPDPWPRVFGFHEIFHAFVILAAVMHFVALAGWVVLA